MEKNLFVEGNATTNIMTVGLELKENIEIYQDSIRAEGIVEMLDYGNEVGCMFISGSTVHICKPYSDYAYVYYPSYDDNKLYLSLQAYNIDKNTNYSIENIKEYYNNHSKEFTDYMNWFNHGGDDRMDDYMNNLEKKTGIQRNELLEMDINKLEEYVNENK